MSTDTVDMQRIKSEAQDWIVELSSDDIGAREKEAFSQWLNADPRHAEAYWRSRKLWAALGIPSVVDTIAAESDSVALLSKPAVRNATLRTDKSRWAWPTALAATVLLAVSGLLYLSPFGDQSESAGMVATQTAQVRDLILKDGSTVTLGAKSVVDIEVNSHGRRVTLIGGEAFFEVARDPERPFTVMVDGIDVQVVGTRFDVHRGVEQVRVAVLDGAVKVAVSDQSDEMLTAGRQLVTRRDTGVVQVSDIKGATPGDWRNGRLSYQGTPLIEVIADANRYYNKRIIIGSTELNDLKVTASFRTDRIDQFLDTLVAGLPVKVEDTGFGLTIMAIQ